MTRILNDKERSKLLEAYKADRMKDAPVNISDKTLIENFGTDAQKQLLSGFAPADKTPKGTEKETAGTGTGTEQPAAATEPAAAEAEKVNPEQNKAAEITSKSDDNTAYLDAFNEYVLLSGGKTPSSELTTEQILKVSDELREQLKKEPAPEPKQTPVVVNTEAANKGMETISVRHKKTGETRTMTKFTYAKFFAGVNSDYVPADLPELK